jgi:hypothetical protein
MDSAKQGSLKSYGFRSLHACFQNYERSALS